MPKAATEALSKRRHNPLEQDIVATGHLRTKPAKKSKQRSIVEEGGYIDARSTSRVLQLGRELLEEDEADTKPALPPTFGLEAARFDHHSDEDEPNALAENVEDEWGDYDDVEEEEVDVADLQTFNKFNPGAEEDDLLTYGWDRRPDGNAQQPNRAGSVDLAALIMAKIKEKEAGETKGGPRANVGPIDDELDLPPKVVEVYSKIGLIMSRYRSGKLPKPFKVMPMMPYWEELLGLTQAENWTPNACFAATRIFIAAPAPVATRFLETVLMEKVRDDIAENKKLNVHLMNALKKALFKPACFFKGILLPMVSGGVTQREAHVISFALSRTSIPVIHSAAALSGLCDIASSAPSSDLGAINIFIKTLLEKKYALPWQVIDTLVLYFLRFRSVESEKLPVLLHQSFLVFAQRYRNDISEDQREALLDLLLSHGHHAIGPEVRRELLAGRGRGVAIEQPGASLDGDDTMMVD